MVKNIESNVVVLVYEHREYKVKFMKYSTIVNHDVLMIYRPSKISVDRVDTSYIKNKLIAEDYFIDKRSRNFKPEYHLDDIASIFYNFCYDYGGEIEDLRDVESYIRNKVNRNKRKREASDNEDSEDSDSDQMDVDEPTSQKDYLIKREKLFHFITPKAIAI